MITYLQQNNILQRIIVLDNRVRENTFLMENLTNINVLDDIMTERV